MDTKKLTTLVDLAETQSYSETAEGYFCRNRPCQNTLWL